MQYDFVGNGKIANFAKEFRSYIENGTSYIENGTEKNRSNRLRSFSEKPGTGIGLGGRDNPGRQEQSSDKEGRGRSESESAENAILFRDDDISEGDRAIARGAYVRMVASGRYQFQESDAGSHMFLFPVVSNSQLYRTFLCLGSSVLSVINQFECRCSHILLCLVYAQEKSSSHKCVYNSDYMIVCDML